MPSQQPVKAESCEVCGEKIEMICRLRTGVCSENCQKTKDGDW